MKTMTHYWSANSSQRLELWLHGRILWGGGSKRQTFRCSWSRGERLEQHFSYLLLCNHCKTLCHKITSFMFSHNSPTEQQSLGMVHLCCLWHKMAWLNWSKKIPDPHSSVFHITWGSHDWLGFFYISLWSLSIRCLLRLLFLEVNSKEGKTWKLQSFLIPRLGSHIAFLPLCSIVKAGHKTNLASRKGEIYPTSFGRSSTDVRGSWQLSADHVW